MSPASVMPMMEAVNLGGGVGLAWNDWLFLAVNASARPPEAVRLLAVLLAGAPLLLVPRLLVGLWVWGRPSARAGLIATAGGVLAGQGINVLLGLLWFEKRPFMAGIGHTLMRHAADNGFPSDHATLCWGCGLGLIATGAARRWGVAACALGLGTGWARVFLGVHFPVDVLVAIPVGAVAAGLARLALPAIRRHVAPPAERLYAAVLARLPTGLPIPR